MTMQAKPAFGRAIVKRIAPGRTAAGLHIPDTANEFKWELVATSEGHTVDGHFVPAEGKPGDYIILGAFRREKVVINGREGERSTYNTKESELLPPDHVVIKLHEIEAYVPAAAVAVSERGEQQSSELPKGPVH